MRRIRLRVRLVLATFALSTLLVGIGVTGLIGSLDHEADVAIAARLKDRSTALAATVGPDGTTVDVTGADEALFDGRNWVFDLAGRRIEGPRLSPAADRVLRPLSMTREPATGTLGTLRLRAVPVRIAGRPIAVAVTAVDSAPYTASLESIARWATALGVLVVLGATGLAALVLARSLGPIVRMTEQAATWSRASSGKRFASGPPTDEITGLAAVLDELLGRVEAALDGERRLTAEIAHELRSPLTLLQGESELALMSRATPDSERARYERIHDAATAMSRAMTALLDAAAPAAADAVSDPLEAVRAVLAASPLTPPVRVHGEGAPVPVPLAHVERILAPVLHNASAAARSAVSVHLSTTADAVRIAVVDDGAGVDAAVGDRLFEPGVTTREGGTGLGLPLARRLARDAGGDVVLASTAPTRFEVVLPRSPVATG